MSWRGREGLGDLLEWSGGPAGCPAVVEKPFRMSESGRKALGNLREW